MHVSAGGHGGTARLTGGTSVRGREHLALAVATSGGILYLLNHGQPDFTGSAVAAVALAGAGSLMPDVDHPQSWVSSRIPATFVAAGGMVLLSYWLMKMAVAKAGAQGPFSAVYESLLEMSRPILAWAWLSLVVGFLMFGIARVIAGTFEHRGPTHSFSAALLVTASASVALAIAGEPLISGLWLGWGYLTHLLSDLPGRTGCPALLWPWRGGALAALGGDAPPAMANVTIASASPSAPSDELAASRALSGSVQVHSTSVTWTDTDGRREIPAAEEPPDE